MVGRVGWALSLKLGGLGYSQLVSSLVVFFKPIYSKIHSERQSSCILVPNMTTFHVIVREKTTRTLTFNH